MGLFGGDTTVANADRALQTDPNITAQLAPVFAITQPIGGNFSDDHRANLDVRGGDNSPQTVIQNIGLTESWALGYAELVREQQRDLLAAQQQSNSGDLAAALNAMATQWPGAATTPGGDVSVNVTTPAGGGGGGGGADPPATPASDTEPATPWPIISVILGAIMFLSN